MEYSENRDSYAKIATLYYIANLSQDEIASMFGISRYKVSRVLKKCRLLKIVEFQINNQPGYYSNIEKQIKENLKILQVTIAPSGSTLQKSKENVARAAAYYLEQTIKDGMKIGLSWGSTIQLLLKYYEKDESFPNAIFVQLSGNICTRSITNNGFMDGNIFVRQMAEKTRSGWAVLQLPYIVQNPSLKELLYQEPQINKHIALFQKLDMAIIGIGSDDPSKSVSFLSGYISFEDTKKLSDDGMGADICGTRLTADGKLRETFLSNRVITIDISDLYNMSEVCAVGAGAEKAHSIIAGCRGGYIKRIIIDEVCALSLLNLL